jgi:hypothetical protein
LRRDSKLSSNYFPISREENIPGCRYVVYRRRIKVIIMQSELPQSESRMRDVHHQDLQYQAVTVLAVVLLLCSAAIF